MENDVTDTLDAAIRALPLSYPGPGGAIAILQRGELVTEHCWGWANAETRSPFTPQTMFLMCSITKHFTCALLRDRFPDPSMLDEEVAHFLPDFAGPSPTIAELCHNQSGLRDYWALAMLCGAPPEGRFDQADARTLIGRTRSLHFAPGTRYSYSNGNFRILSDILERRLDRSFAELLRTRVLDRASMPTAALNPETGDVPGGTTGYEGTPETGFRPAINRIRWTGDAGLAASLADMIAWERHVDEMRDDPDGLYTSLTGPIRFRDGNEAAYGFGLSRAPLLGRTATSHGGALRGWRSFRAYLPAERLSIVVLFNHMSDARAAALDLLAAALDIPRATPPAEERSIAGRYIEPESGLAARIDIPPGAPVSLLFATYPEILGPDATTGLRTEPDGLWMDRASENWQARLVPIDAPSGALPEGTYRSAELGALLTCTTKGGVAYGAFSGFLGDGAMQALVPFGPDTWLLPCPRALDHSPPGDWTLRFRPDGSAVQVGCWLARNMVFERVSRSAPNAPG